MVAGQNAGSDTPPVGGVRKPYYVENIDSVQQNANKSGIFNVTCSIALKESNKIDWYRRGYRGRRQGQITFIVNTVKKLVTVSGTSIVFSQADTDYFMSICNPPKDGQPTAAEEVPDTTAMAVS